jgi:hypothetical protein
MRDVNELRAQIEKDRQDTQRIEKQLQRKFVELLRLVSEAGGKLRESAIQSYAGFASLRLIQYCGQKLNCHMGNGAIVTN